MGESADRRGGMGGAWLALVLLLSLCLSCASLAGETYPADLSFRDGFDGVERFTTELGAEPFQAPDSPAFEPGASRTLEAWVYVTGNDQRTFIMGKGIPVGFGGVTRRFTLEIFNGKYSFNTDSYSVVDPSPVAKRVWTHVAAVVDASGARLYINGVLVDSRVGVAPVIAEPTVRFGVGSPVNSDGTGLRGYDPGVYAKQVRFWSVARTQAQLLAGMNQLRPSDATGLVANWPMDEGGGTVARDISGFGRALSKAIDIGAARLSVVENGPHFMESHSAVTPGVMPDVTAVQEIDFDGDGDLDLFLTQSHNPPVYPAIYERQLAFRNIGGSFVDATDAVLGTLMTVTIRRIWLADFNADGRKDLFLAETGADTEPVPGAQSRILIQSADGRLVDETASRLPAHDFYTHGLAVADIDGDGDLDVYMGNFSRFTPVIYLNDGTGHFSEATGRLPADVAVDTQHPAVTFCDVNRDNHPDVLLGGAYYPPAGEAAADPNVLLMNDGTGRFVHDPAFTIPPKLFGAKGTGDDIACADLNGDGAPEVVIATDIGGNTPGLQLLLNDGAGHFADASAQLNFTFSNSDKWVEAITVADINADGKPDLVLRMDNYILNEYPHTVSILLNRGGAVFVNASETFTGSTAQGVAVADFDGDGRLDLVTPDSYHSQIKLFHNAKIPALALLDPPTACQLDRWSSVTASGSVGTTLVVGGPSDAAPLPRYSGLCSLRANAPGNFVSDDSPTNLSSFHARFYVLANVGGGAAEIFKARNAAMAAMLAVRYTGASFDLAGSSGAYAASQAVIPGRWYAIDVDWAAGVAPTMTVQGAGGAALPVVTAAAAAAGDRIDSVQLGWLAGGSAGSIVVDAYEARRDTAPARLCRGDADGTGLRDGRDITAARSEFLQQGLAPRQPDCNEDGEVNSGDLLCLRNMQAASQGDCAVFPGL